MFIFRKYIPYLSVGVLGFVLVALLALTLFHVRRSQEVIRLLKLEDRQRWIGDASDQALLNGTSALARLAILTRDIPTQEEILLIRSFNGRFLILTNPGPIDVGEQEGQRAQVNIWLADIGNSSLSLVKNHRMEMTAFLGDVAILVDESDSKSGYVDIEIQGIGEGPFGWEEIDHEYLEANSLEHVASTVWTSSFGSKLHVEINGTRKTFTLEAQNGCRESYEDKLIGIHMDDVEILFKKSLPFECLMFGEGAPMPALPGFSAPRLEYGSIVFSPPVGADISIPLDGGFKEIRSDDFAKE